MQTNYHIIFLSHQLTNRIPAMQLLNKLRPLPLAIFLFSFLQISAQTVSIDGLLELPVEDVPVFDTVHCPNCIFLKINFGTADFQNLDVLKRFRKEDIDQVEMVYTDFSRSAGFNQAVLNRERLEKLHAVAGELFANSDIRWSIKRQTDCHSYEQCSGFFHGFVVHLLPGKAKKDMEGKLAPSTTVPLPKKTSVAKPRLVTRDTVIREMSVSIRENTTTDCVYTGKYVPNDKAKARKGVRYDKPGKGRRKEKKCTTTSLGFVYDTAYYDRKYRIDARTGKLLDKSIDVDRRGDTTVIDAMERNWNDWKNEKVIVVQDVTGSMSDYLTQILTWHELYAAKGVENYIFFNDGDQKPDAQKKIGKTGGIYYVQSTRLSEIQDKAHEAMRAGSGGDNPENNIEAAIYAQDKCPDCTMMVMIADNFASVKDLELLEKVKIPVQIVVCGGNGEQVRSDYLSIAAVTGGAVHTSKMDLELKGEVVEGQTLVVGERKYLFEKGRFKLTER